MTEYSKRYLVPTFNGLVAQIGLSAGVSVVCVGVFEWNRRKKTLQYLYSPRCGLKTNATPPMSLKFLGWINPTLKIPEEFYIANVGLDAVMFLRFIKMCFQFCVFNAIIVGIILLPIHYTASGGLTEVPRLSITNVPDDSNVLWAHVFLTYVVSLTWMFLLFKNYWQWMDLRREYTLQRIRQGEIAERSIFISRLPSNLRSDQALKQYFESLKMGPVESATVVQHCGRLSQKIDRRESALNLLEKAHVDLAREVLEAIKEGKFTLADLFNGANIAPGTSPETTLTKQLTLGHQVWDPTMLEKMVSDLYLDKKRFHKTRKSIFAHKRVPPPAPQPQLNIPLSALSHHSDIIDIYVHGGEPMDPAGSSMSLHPPPFTIWDALVALDRHQLDAFQPTRPARRFKGGQRMESIDYFVKKYNKLDRKVGELRDGSLRYKSTPFGFVTFKHHLSAQLCAQSKIDSRPQGLNVRLAMEPRDVLWSNLTASFRNRFSRSVFVTLSVWALIIFWIFPTSSFLLLTSLGQLSEKFAFLRPILEASNLIQSLLQNVLPIIFVTIFLALAPVIILEISKQELPVSHSALEGNVLRRYYHFLIFNILFVFMIGTAILKSIITLIKTPTNIFTLLAASLPSGSTFFIFYIVFNTCTHALELVQVWGQLVIHAFVTARKLTPTPRALQRATTPWNFQYYYYYPQIILAMVITMIYSIISPLILFAAVVYFGFALLVFKYQLAYCYIRKYENSGRFFRHVFQYTTDGLIILQITMVGVLWLKQAIVGGFFVVVLIGLTIYFKILCGDLFRSRTKFLPLDTGLRNFDNDSSLAMNEIPVDVVHGTSSAAAHRGYSGGNLSENSSMMDSGLRFRSHGDSSADRQGLWQTARPSEKSAHGSFSLPQRLSSQSARYEKLKADKTDGKDSRGSIEKVGMEAASPPSIHTSGQGPSSETDRGYYTGPTGLGLSVSGMMEDLHEVDRTTRNSSRNSLALRVQTKVNVGPSEKSEKSEGGSTKDIRLFTVGDDPLAGPKEILTTHDEVEEFYNGGFLEEDGFYLENYGIPSSGMGCRLLASHYDHTPSRLTYQDRTSDIETYIHPALLKPLNRKLWLPRNPLYEHWDLDDTVEVEFALNSTATMNKHEFRVHGKEEEPLQSPKAGLDQPSIQHQHQHPQQPIRRRNTIGSTLEGALNVPTPSPSNWEGCLSDSPPLSAAASTATQQQQKSLQDEKRSDISSKYHDETAVNSAQTPNISQFPGRNNSRTRPPIGQGHSTAVEVGDGLEDSVVGSPLSHSTSMNSVGAFSPTTPGAPGMPVSPAGDSLSVHQTRFKRSASMPPTPLLSSGESETATPRQTQVGSSSFLSVRHPYQAAGHGQQPQQHHRSNIVLPTTTVATPHQSPRVIFVQQDGSPAANTTPTTTINPLLNNVTNTTPLAVRSTMFGTPLLHRHTVSHGQGNSIHHSPHRTGSGILVGAAGATQLAVPSSGIQPSTMAPGAGIPIALSNNNTTTTTATATTTNATGTSTRKPAARGTAGAFFNMIFGDDEDEEEDSDAKSRFGYETGGMWSIRRGSHDRHDDDDDDDDDDSEQGAEKDAQDDLDVGGGGRQGTVSVMIGSPTSMSDAEGVGSPPRLAQPSFLDLTTESLMRVGSGSSPGQGRQALGHVQGHQRTRSRTMSHAHSTTASSPVATSPLSASARASMDHQQQQNRFRSNSTAVKSGFQFF